jgi:hypothetical protein
LLKGDEVEKFNGIFESLKADADEPTRVPD